MPSLLTRHTRALSEALLKLYEPGNMATLPERLFEVMHILAPGHLMHISVTKPGVGAVDAFLNLPAHRELMGLVERRSELLTMPGVRDSSFYLAADEGPTSFHDLMSADELERTVLWEAFCQPLDLRHDLSVNFHRTDELFYTLSSSRDTRPYTAEERLLVSLLQPHLRQRFRQLLAAEPGHPLGRPNVSPADTHWLLCDDDGRVLEMNAGARDMLASVGLRLRGMLPDDMRTWLRSGLSDTNVRGDDPARPFVHAIRRGRLIIHALRNRHSRQHRLILHLEPYAEGKLTRRETEVAEWLAEGKSNAEIGAILGVSPATIKVHVERILAKLGVENRTAAANVFRTFARNP